ncbi:hypothetical protein LGK95_01685 [Clostridium algoriphilum]|uniref:hypothetical protein n=1 Tax=Clostridium algoriphilum TaxID=198347 RepID=UPI001CF2718C|nr:hypothetical protein [Clostridium algoriphilum]MCB2292249.1 hypothetical protein [Clostridium algoriphilum]
MSATSMPMWRADPNLSDCVTFVPNAYNKDKTLEVAATESLKAIEDVIKTKGADKIATAFTKASASTLGGNPIYSSTAIAVLEYIEKNNLCLNAK